MALALVTSVTSYIQWQLSKPGNDWDHRHATTSLSPPPGANSKFGEKSFFFTAPRLWNRLPLTVRRKESTDAPSRWRLRLSYIAMLMYLTLNGSDNCTAIAPRPCNGLPMLRRGLEVVGLIIIIIIINQRRRLKASVPINAGSLLNAGVSMSVF